MDSISTAGNLGITCSSSRNIYSWTNTSIFLTQLRRNSFIIRSIFQEPGDTKILQCPIYRGSLTETILRKNRV